MVVEQYKQQSWFALAGKDLRAFAVFALIFVVCFYVLRHLENVVPQVAGISFKVYGCIEAWVLDPGHYLAKGGSVNWR